MRTRFSYLAYTMLKTGRSYHELGCTVLWDNARRQQVVAAQALPGGPGRSRARKTASRTLPVRLAGRQPFNWLANSADAVPRRRVTGNSNRNARV